MATKLIDNGADADRLVFVVMGDGYAQNDQTTYQNDVNRLLVNGVFLHDVFAANRRAVNLYRVDLISSDARVSTPTSTKNTALKLIYNGQWSSCWISESAGSDALIRAQLKGIDYNFVVLLINEAKFGGCTRGHRLYITNGIQWDLVAHEYGHGIGGLYEEYTSNTPYTGPEINDANCSTVLDRQRVVWHNLIAATTPLPTAIGGAITDTTVGMFEGGNAYKSGIYRPANNCLMNVSDQNPPPPFCPVCRGLMQTELGRWLPHPAAPARSDIVPEGEKRYYLFVEARITSDGHVDVLSVQELEGTPTVVTSARSRFAYEVLLDGNTILGEAFAADPFVARAFPDPTQPGRAHGYARSNTALIHIRIPMSLKELSTKPVGLKVYAVAPPSQTATTTVLPPAATQPGLLTPRTRTLIADVQPERFAAALAVAAR